MKNFTIKFLCLCLIVCLLTSLCACKQNNANSDATSDEAIVSKTVSATPDQATEALGANVVVPTQSQTTVDSKKSDPNDIYDATGFVSISDVIPDVILDIRYYSTYNFVGARIDDYEQPIALLSKEAAAALKNVSDELREKGYRLKIFDAYRPQTAVDHFASWAKDVNDTKMKKYFYPDVDKSLLFDYGYIAYRSGHSRGCTVDLTLFDINTGQEVDMGSSFDYFGTISHPDYTGITTQQYNNRMILREAMTNNGFRACATEWWDFTFVQEPYPNTYFSFPVSTDSLS